MPPAGVEPAQAELKAQNPTYWATMAQANIGVRFRCVWVMFVSWNEKSRRDVFSGRLLRSWDLLVIPLRSAALHVLGLGVRWLEVDGFRATTHQPRPCKAGIRCARQRATEHVGAEALDGGEEGGHCVLR